MPAEPEVYDGPVCYIDGIHYAVKVDRDGNEIGPDKKMPLVWVDNDPGSTEGNPYAHYRRKTKADPSHEHVYHQRTVELEPE